MMTASEAFRALPPLLAEEMEELSPGKVLRLQLHEHLPAGGSALFEVRYTHKSFAFRTEGRKDAVAFGTAEIEGSEPRDVRILFSAPNRTATMKGAVLEGQVKPSPIRWGSTQS